MLLRTIPALAVLVGLTLAAVNPVDVVGNEFVDTVSKNRLMIVGVDYQPGAQSGFDPEADSDILSNEKTCLRDAALLQKLGVNTIRVYNVNPKVNHDMCMSIFNGAGIYVIVDVNSPVVSINREDPGSTYHKGYLEYVFSNVENFKGYPNTLAFFAANEVMNDMNTAEFNPQYIRAVQRDLRQYIAKHSSRHIPVGYSAADVRPILQDTWAYMQCAIGGKNDDSSSEFFGLNSYSWCGGDATYKSAGYDKLVTMFDSSTVPVFFSEYGCNKPAGVPRLFNEVGALYGPDMTKLSGGLVYEYSQEEADYGLVEIKGDEVHLRKDYDNLQGQYNKLDVKLLQAKPSGNSNPSIPKCDASFIENAGFSKNFTLPPQPPGALELINGGVKNAVQGKIVDVKSWDNPLPVYGSDGKEIKGLVVKQVSGSNLPGGQSTTGGEGEGKKGAASGRVGAGVVWPAVAALVAVAAGVSVGL